MSFESDMARILANIERRRQRLFDNCVDHVHRSITYGSPVTGAPGQPVKFGILRPSYKKKYHSRNLAESSSTLHYAGEIEHNLRGAQLRSKVGGFHSVKLTRAGWRRIVAYELKRMGPSGSGLNVTTTS